MLNNGLNSENINTSRRNFLTKGAILAGGILASTNIFANKILDNSGNNKSNINFIEKYNDSIYNLGKEQVDFFMSYYNISGGDYKDFVSNVKGLQALHSLKIDGVLGPNTINVFYEEIEKIGLLNNFPIEIRSRIKAKNTLDNYINNPRLLGNRKIRPGKIPNVYREECDDKGNIRKSYFYGDGVGENIKGYFLNEKLYLDLKKSGKLEKENFFNFGNFLKIDKLGSKYYLSMYVNGILQVLTYISPGTGSHKTPNIDGRKLGVLEKYHISSSYPKRDGINSSGGAVMPFAVHIFGPIWFHCGQVNGNGLSHGCIRVPVFYQQKIFELIEGIGSKNFIIKSGKLY